MPKINKVMSLEITPEQFLNSCSPLELREIDMLIQKPVYTNRMNLQMCVVCSCTDDDCSQCIEKTGGPCHWVSPNLCSACAETAQKIEHEPS